jgi:hypothetical protein
MSDPTPASPPTPKKWTCAGALVLLLCFGLPVGWCVAMMIAAGAGRSREGVVATLNEVGPAALRAEALALLATTSQRRTVPEGSLPPGLAKLRPIYVDLVPPDFVMVKIAGMGDWAGLVISRTGEPHAGMGGERVAEGIYWVQPR